MIEIGSTQYKILVVIVGICFWIFQETYLIVIDIYSPTSANYRKNSYSHINNSS